LALHPELTCTMQGQHSRITSTKAAHRWPRDVQKAPAASTYVEHRATGT